MPDVLMVNMEVLKSLQKELQTAGNRLLNTAAGIPQASHISMDVSRVKLLPLNCSMSGIKLIHGRLGETMSSYREAVNAYGELCKQLAYRIREAEQRLCEAENGLEHMLAQENTDKEPDVKENTQDNKNKNQLTEMIDGLESILFALFEAAGFPVEMITLMMKLFMVTSDFDGKDIRKLLDEIVGLMKEAEATSSWFGSSAKMVTSALKCGYDDVMRCINGEISAEQAVVEITVTMSMQLILTSGAPLVAMALIPNPLLANMVGKGAVAVADAINKWATGKGIAEEAGDVAGNLYGALHPTDANVDQRTGSPSSPDGYGGGSSSGDGSSGGGSGGGGGSSIGRF